MSYHLCDSCRYQQPECNGRPLCDINSGLIVECAKYSKESCCWSNDENADENTYETLWQTSCGKELVLNEGTPDSNGFDYCPFCSKTIDQLVES